MFLRSITSLFFFTVIFLPQTVFSQQTKWTPSEVQNTSESIKVKIGPHGGRIFERAKHFFEIVGDPDGIRVYLRDRSAQTIDLKQITGEVSFVDDSGKLLSIPFSVKKDPRHYRPRLKGSSVKRGHHLFAPADFSLVQDGALRLRFRFYVNADGQMDTVHFATAYFMTPLKGWICRGHEKRIFLEYKDQKLCNKEYLDEIPVLFQCPEHKHSRSLKPSRCPLCSAKRVLTRQDPGGEQTDRGTLRQKSLQGNPSSLRRR